MKELIVGLAMLMLLLIFPLQDMRDTIINHQLELYEIEVRNSVQLARTDGYFTPQNINNLRSKIQAIFPDVVAGEIVINVTTTPKYRLNAFDIRESITYDIGVPVKNVILVGDFLGIPPNVNQFTARKNSFVYSEKLP